MRRAIQKSRRLRNELPVEGVPKLLCSQEGMGILVCRKISSCFPKRTTSSENFEGYGEAGCMKIGIPRIVIRYNKVGSTQGTYSTSLDGHYTEAMEAVFFC